MKRIVTMMAIAITALTFSLNVSAQPAEKQRINREQMAEKQARHIAIELSLDDATTQKFVTTFCACKKEIWALGPKDKKKHKADMTEAEAEEALKARFEKKQKILSIREKYYKEYSKFLTQTQIARAYELEKDDMGRLAKNHHKGGGKRKMHNKNR